MEKILFLDNTIDNDTYQPLTYWEPVLFFPFDLCRVSADERPSGLEEYSHVLITGSTASVLDDADWMQAEAELIRSAVNQGKVILGSCFGHQIIARALFGMQKVRRRKKPEIGWPDIEVLADDPLLGKAGRTINGFLFHYDEVCHLPDGDAAVIARSINCENLAFKLKDRPVWGIQPHFEIGIVEGLKYLDIVSGADVPGRQSYFTTRQDPPRDSGGIFPLMQAFHEARPLR